MIAGLLLRNYKCYNNINFIPITFNTNSKYSVYMGNNGVGKSAVLEALDVFFNDRDWNVNISAKKESAFVCPIFLIEKESFNNLCNLDEDITKAVSDYFWNVTEKANSNIGNHEHLKKFLEFRDGFIEEYKDTYYFIMLGKDYNNARGVYFTTFDDNIYEELIKVIKDSDMQDLEKRLNNLKKSLLDYYSYIYIPVEQPINEILKLETKEMQALLNKNILEEIEKVLNEKVSYAETGKNHSIVKHINDQLDKFIEDVNEALSQIDASYSYKHEAFGKKSLTAKDIREKILEAYFPLRNLKKNKRNLSQLSSGEQRKALIDIAYSILTTNGDNETEKNIILAIDEPETSMHISNCFEQFAMLERLSNIYKKQVLITTHWYGFLPITTTGFMHYIVKEDENKINISSFNFFNYLEEKKNYPDVVELKSMFDLATSILTYMRNNPHISWIICEGSDDKTYLEYVLKDMTNLKVLPVGGCGNVVKMFQLLYAPISEKIEVKTIKGKILFLIDTDKQFKKVEKPMYFNGDVDNIAYIRRLQTESNNIKLVNPVKEDIYEETEIEDCLNPEMYYRTIKNIIDQSDNEEIKDIISNFEFNSEACLSKIKGDNSCIIAKTASYQKKKADLINFLGENDIKYKIANEYIKICQASSVKIEHKLEECIIKIFTNN